MMRYRNPMILVAVAGALTLAAPAAESQTPAPAGTYHLVAVAGQALPVVVEREGDCTEEVLSATLTLEPGGEYTLLVAEREVCGQRVEEDEEREEGTYSVAGTTVRFGREADPGEDDDPEDEIELDELSVGTLAAGALMVRLADGRTVVDFRP